MDWVLGEARRPRRGGALSLGLHRKSPRQALLRALRLRGGRALCLHGRQPCRRATSSCGRACERRNHPRGVARTACRHGFLGRRGGVSRGVCAGPQCRPRLGRRPRRDRGKSPPRGRRGRARRELVTVHQVHSAEAVYADAPWPDDARPKADAMVTDRPGLALGILTADCAPILLADRQAGVIGAAHAGWKGALGGVVEATVAAMERLGADRARIAAAVGPGASPAGPTRSTRPSCAASPKPIRTMSASSPPAARPSPVRPRSLCPLPPRRAPASTRAEALGLDTYSEPDRFFSYRRATHRGEPDYGRQISLIALP